MSWLGATDFDGVLGLRPDLHADYQDFLALFRTQRPVDPVVLELCRLRIAQLLRCRSELAAGTVGLGDDTLAALADWPTSPRFTAVERACLAFTEQFVMDAHGITDTQAAEVSGHLGAAGLVALTEALALFEGFARFRLILGVGDPVERESQR